MLEYASSMQHHAIPRVYLSQIARRRTAFGKRYVWWVDEPLDIALMRAAASACVGEYDSPGSATVSRTR